jgi:hypothetical protein
VILIKCDLFNSIKLNLFNFFQNNCLQEEQAKLAQQLKINIIYILLITSINRQNETLLSNQIISKSFNICIKAFLSCLYVISDFFKKVTCINGIQYNFI